VHLHLHLFSISWIQSSPRRAGYKTFHILQTVKKIQIYGPELQSCSLHRTVLTLIR
jgi:hypothetical protein